MNRCKWFRQKIFWLLEPAKQRKIIRYLIHRSYRVSIPSFNHPSLSLYLSSCWSNLYHLYYSLLGIQSRTSLWSPLHRESIHQYRRDYHRNTTPTNPLWRWWPSKRDPWAAIQSGGGDISLYWGYHQPGRGVGGYSFIAEIGTVSSEETIQRSAILC